MPALFLAVCGPAVTATATPAPDGAADLARRLDRLEERLDRLAGRAAPPLERDRAEAIRGLIGEVLADADRRTALRDDEATAGWDEDFFIRSADGRFLLEVAGQIQVRFTYNRRQGVEDVWGLENRRTKIKLKGYALDPRLRYSVQLAGDRDGGAVEMQDAYVEYEVADDLKFRVGRYRSSLLREFDVSSKRQLAVERSLVARTFRQDRTVGLALRYEGDTLAIKSAFMDASERNRRDDSWLAAVRAEIALSGRLKDLRDFTRFPTDDDDDEPAVSIGGGVLFQDIEFDMFGEDLGRTTRWTVDLSAEGGGMNFMTAFVANHYDPQDGGDSLDQYGATIQGGVFVTPRTELFVRYEWGDADEIAPGLSVITTGFNYYFAEHALKLTMDVGYGLNEVAAFWSSQGAGWLEDEPGDDGQIVVRTQFQMLW